MFIPRWCSVCIALSLTLSSVFLSGCSKKESQDKLPPQVTQANMTVSTLIKTEARELVQNKLFQTNISPERREEKPYLPWPKPYVDPNKKAPGDEEDSSTGMM